MDDEDSSGGGGVLTRRVGPLAAWQWLALATAVAVGYYFLVAKKKTAAAAAAAPSVPSQDVPQFVIQNQFPFQPAGPPATGPSQTPPPLPVTAPPVNATPAPPTAAGGPAPVKTPVTSGPAPHDAAHGYVTAGGKTTLTELAKTYGLSEYTLKRLNPNLKYAATTNLPKGTVVFTGKPTTAPHPAVSL